MSLFTSLSTAARALDAQRYGLDVAGQNIANVNTAGYTRRTVDLTAVPPDGSRNPGRGVDVAGVRALRDRMLEVRLQRELPAQRREAAMAQALSVVEAALGDPGSSIDKSLENFYDGFARLAEAPLSSVAREDVLLQGSSLASAFRNMAQRLDSARLDADRHVRTIMLDVNALAGQIAHLNQAIGAGGDPDAALHTRDEQNQLVKQLSELVDIHVLDRPEGGVDISIGNGRPLIVGETSYAVAVTNAPPAGLAALSVNGTAVTGEITGGRLGGMLQVRDVNIPDYITRLDQLAFDVAGQVNAIHAAGFDQTGAAGGDFFAFSSAIVGSAGAAAALIVDTTVAADSRRIAAGAIASPGDNQAARSIAGLRVRPVLNGNTATLADSWGQFVYRVARDSRAAADESKSRSEIVRQVEALRDSVSGVSLDEEAMHLLKFQRAYEANARFFSTIDQTLEMLLAAIGR